MNELWRIDAQGWLTADEAGGPGTRSVVSPNRDARPAGASPSLLVLHSISLPPGEFSGNAIADLFMNRLDCDIHPYFVQLRGVRVSTHFLIRRDGEVIQVVSTEMRAWHAGASRFFGRKRCNDFSIGVELEGTDHGVFTEAQYEALMRLCRALLARYPLAACAGHADLAPGRKTDPGPGFDWARLQAALALLEEFFPYRHPGGFCRNNVLG